MMGKREKREGEREMTDAGEECYRAGGSASTWNSQCKFNTCTYDKLKLQSLLLSIFPWGKLLNRSLFLCICPYVFTLCISG